MERQAILTDADLTFFFQMMYILPDVLPESELAYQYETSHPSKKVGYEADTQRMINNSWTNAEKFLGYLIFL